MTFSVPWISALFDFTGVSLGRQAPLFQLTLASLRELFPNVGHLFQLEPVGGGRGTRHFSTFGGVPQVISVFSHHPNPYVRMRTLKVRFSFHITQLVVGQIAAVQFWFWRRRIYPLGLLGTCFPSFCNFHQRLSVFRLHLGCNAKTFGRISAIGLRVEQGFLLLEGNVTRGDTVLEQICEY